MHVRTVLGLATVGLAGLVGAGCAGDSGPTNLETITPTSAATAVTPTTVDPADVAACSGRVKDTVAGYGRIDTLSFAAKMSGDQVAAWKHFPAAQVSSGIGSPNITPQALGLDPNESLELCIFDGLFSNAAMPTEPGADLGPVVEIGVLVRCDGSVILNYMRPAKAAAVTPPTSHL